MTSPPQPASTAQVRPLGPSSPTLVRLLFAGVLFALVAASLLQRYAGHAMAEPDLDFFDYYFQARAVLAGPHRPLYTDALEGNPVMRPVPATGPIAAMANAAHVNIPNQYIYPPLLADLLTPLARLSPARAATVWRLANLLLVAVTCILIARWLAVRLLSLEFAVLVMAAFSFWPVHETLSLGQVSIAIMALWALAIVSYAEDKVVVSALALAVATMLKVTPILVLPVMVLWNERRWIAAYLASLAALALALVAWNGWSNLAASIAVLRKVDSVVPALANKGIGAIVGWLYYRRTFTFGDARALIVAQQPHALLFAAKLVDLLFFAICLALVWRRRRGVDRRADAHVLAALAVVCVLCSPISWRHGYAVAFILFAALWVRELRSSSSRPFYAAVLATASFTLGTLFFDLVGRLGGMPGTLQILCAGLWPVSCALLCLDLFRPSAGRPPRTA